MSQVVAHTDLAERLSDVVVGAKRDEPCRHAKSPFDPRRHSISVSQAVWVVAMAHLGARFSDFLRPDLDKAGGIEKDPLGAFRTSGPLR